MTAEAIYERLAVRDIQETADVLRPVYDKTQRRDGFVSLEVSPRLAQQTETTIWRPSPLENGRPAEPDDQGTRHAGRHTGRSAP